MVEGMGELLGIFTTAPGDGTRPLSLSNAFCAAGLTQIAAFSLPFANFNHLVLCITVLISYLLEIAENYGLNRNHIITFLSLFFAWGLSRYFIIKTHEVKSRDLTITS